MKSINWIKIVVFTALFAFVSVPVYALFKDTTDPNVVKSRLMMRRKKAKQMTKKAEAEKTQIKSSQTTTDQQPTEDVYGGPSQKKTEQKATTKTTAPETTQIKKTDENPYKRLGRPKPKKAVAKKTAKKVVVNNVAVKQKRKRSGPNMVLITLLIAIVAGLIAYKKKG